MDKGKVYTLETVPVRGFHLRVLSYTIGGSLTDGYILGMIQFALIVYTADVGLSSVWQGLITSSPLMGVFVGCLVFGRLSDKTHTKLGKRMPYILVGTFCCAVAFPFIPVLFHFHNLAGTIVMMAVVVFFAMMYRNPAVALMPDITPKPLRSKANGIINCY